MRNKAIIVFLAKTGISRHELVELDISDVDLVEMKIRLKPTAKITNRTVFFNDECSSILRRWLKIREGMNRNLSSRIW
ncbi:MAG: tyrosine-type recombinase/integrase [Methanothrix sp.]